MRRDSISFLVNCQSKGLREANDELQAQLFSRGLEEGRTLLSEHLACNSLAAEFEVMSQDDVSEKVNSCEHDARWNAQLSISSLLMATFYV